MMIYKDRTTKRTCQNKGLAIELARSSCVDKDSSSSSVVARAGDGATAMGVDSVVAVDGDDDDDDAAGRLFTLKGISGSIS